MLLQHLYGNMQSIYGRYQCFIATGGVFHGRFAVSGTHVCLREVRAEAIWTSLDNHSVTHLCGAPVVMSTILGVEEKYKRTLRQTVHFFTAAAPPPESVLSQMREEGFVVTHLYGLTEVYGPAVVNDWNEDWNLLSEREQARLKACQGVRYHALENLDVLDPESMTAVPRDGKTIGEVMFRGNIVDERLFKKQTGHG